MSHIENNYTIIIDEETEPHLDFADILSLGASILIAVALLLIAALLFIAFSCLFGLASL